MYITRSCWLEERKLTSQFPSTTVEFSVQYDLKITLVIYIFTAPKKRRRGGDPSVTPCSIWPAREQNPWLLAPIAMSLTTTPSVGYLAESWNLTWNRCTDILNDSCKLQPTCTCLRRDQKKAAIALWLSCLWCWIRQDQKQDWENDRLITMTLGWKGFENVQKQECPNPNV